MEHAVPSLNAIGGLDGDGSFSGFDLGPELSAGLPVRVSVNVVSGALGIGLVRREDPSVPARGSVDVQVETDVVLEQRDKNSCYFLNNYN